MKLNKQEQHALSVLEKIVEAIKNPRSFPLDISEGDDSALLRTFGWSPKVTTTSKGDLKTAVRGKEAPLLVVSGYGPSGAYGRQCFFPFQVKERKPQKVDPETEARRKQYLALENQFRDTIIGGGEQEDIEQLVKMIKAATADESNQR
ncbi:hypothetical protein [Vibrio mediterranei]|uniref:hypothetical protein n=1 Tax=Vibrio mediterranei TaxID=689 RepID=UPI0022849E0D|nr:hypothetical protein [Vibrio mediterranei]MCY9853150.1 hypothetical protein [Vibrio mediterranei]